MSTIFIEYKSTGADDACSSSKGCSNNGAHYSIYFQPSQLSGPFTTNVMLDVTAGKPRKSMIDVELC